MNIRERWRRAKAQRRKINEAINKQLTPEQKLALLRNREPFIVRFLPMIIILLILTVLLVAALAISGLGYGLKYHFGENVWENMMEAGRVEFGSSSGNPHLAVWALVGLAFFLLAIGLYDAFQGDKEETRLKREILGRIKAGRN